MLSVPWYDSTVYILPDSGFKPQGLHVAILPLILSILDQVYCISYSGLPILINTTPSKGMLRRVIIFHDFKNLRRRKAAIWFTVSLAFVKWTKREVFCAVFFLAVSCLLIWRIAGPCLLFTHGKVHSAGKQNSVLFVYSEPLTACGHTLVAV